ncbi:MAG: aspartate-semialdehyde dehydrogenase [Sphingomonadaceae bacterium]|nr:aspartate-semialdehyde dehydrogenase [Sphingomonadaceae bacterium]
MRLLILASALALAACSDAGDPAGEASGDGSTPVAQASAQLGANGITLTGGAEDVLVAFGTPRAEAEATLVPLLGEPQSRDANPECGAGPMEFSNYEGLTLNFQDGTLVGWFAKGAPYLPSETRAELGDAATPFADSTIGEEFTMGEREAIVSGLFASDDADAPVTDLWAGTNCIFR